MQNLNKYGVSYYNGKIQGIVPYNLFYRPGQPIHIKASFLAGARFDTKPGIAHFLEHMILAGSKKYPDKRALVTPLEILGGMVGASTNTDLITVKMEIAEKNDLAVAVEILNEIINQPLFDEQTMETERGSILAEVQMRYHNRAICVGDIYDTLVYQGTVCGVKVIGTEESVKTISRADLINFYQTVFKRNPVSWSISGDVEEADIVNALAKLYTPPVGLEGFFIEKLPIIREKTMIHEVFDDNKTDLILGFRTEPADIADAASLDILLTYLAFDRGCKLQDELRYKRGLIYNVRGFNDLSFDAGNWNIVTSCLADKTQEVLNVIIAELQSLKEKGISPDELRLVKNRIIKSNIRKMQTSDSWAAIASNPAFLTEPEKFLITNYEQAIDQVTPEDVVATAKKYFTSNNWYLAMCGPESLNGIKVNL